MEKLFWEVTVWDSTKKLNQFYVPVGQITVEKLQELLRALTAKHSLTDKETVPCFLKKNTRSYSMLLEVHRSLKPLSYGCGTNPHCYARIVKQEALQVSSNSVIKRTRKKQYSA